MKKNYSFIPATILISSLACGAGFCYGLINDVSRPYVIGLIIASFAFLAIQMKRAPEISEEAE